MFGFETGLDFFEIGGSYQTETANRKKAVLWIRIGFNADHVYLSILVNQYRTTFRPF